MEFTGERFVPEIEGWLALQHFHRYFFVTNQIELNDKVILDIACGEGYGCNILSKFSKHVYGVDLSRESIEHARKKYGKHNLTFIVGDVTSIPLESNFCDVVVSFETIEHHDKHTRMLQEIKRILKTNGILILSSPDKGFYEKYFPSQINDYHVKELYFSEFKKMLAQYFNHNVYFSQNNVIGSLINIENSTPYTLKPIQIEKETGQSMTIEPRFNICISSDRELKIDPSFSICTPRFYFDVFSIINEQKNIINSLKKEIEKIYHSKAWKIYRVVIRPFKFLRKLFK